MRFSDVPLTEAEIKKSMDGLVFSESSNRELSVHLLPIVDNHKLLPLN